MLTFCRQIDEHLPGSSVLHLHANSRSMTEWLPTLVAAAWAILLGGAGGLLTEIGPWYRALRKPSWQPPDWAFGPIWTTILGLAAWAGVLGWNAADTADEQAGVLIVYAVNFVCHIAWSPLFFKLKRPDWSLAESMFLWGSVIAMIDVLANLKPFAAWLLVPYFVWVSIATVLNWTIVRLNGPFGRSASA